MEQNTEGGCTCRKLRYRLTGTPLIVHQGIAPIGRLVQAFPNYPVLADYKTMDSGGRNVHLTAEQGVHNGRTAAIWDNDDIDPGHGLE